LGNVIGVQDCTFNNKPCSKVDFTWYFHYVYGNRLQFNTGVNSTILMTNIEGPLNGLT
jgi:hypothetical protein